ncbi:MAG TPA: hypothetical protein VKR52_12445 [Terracidiphilus sp.]|nr:hypothetical protein [Terracidiphilus sp.]
MTDTPIQMPVRRIEYAGALVFCAAFSALAIGWSWHNHALLNYGDAVAHLEIARRVIDGHNAGYKQLGSVWLPLPHILLIPFVAVYSWWANGIAGLIPSACAYLLGCAGIYRLARQWLTFPAATIALVFFAINPNLLYLQTTAMTEPLFLCELIWAVVWLVEWHRSLDAAPQRSAPLLWRIAFILAAAVFTRYDGWILALIAWTSICVVLMRRGQLRSPAFWLATIVVVSAPAIWFIYNAAIFGDWLDFARGPYSARAIEIRTASPGSGPPHPGWHDPWVSLLFFVRTAELDASAELWGNRLLVLSFLGTAIGCFLARRRAFLWALLLWLPMPFYAYSIAYGSVPIFIPKWWPHSWYNTRYGMELLPAFALSLGFIAHLVLSVLREFKPQWVRYAAGLICALAVWNAWKVIAEKPLTYIEGVKNIEARRPLEQQIPPVLRKLLATRPKGLVLMKTSVYPNLVAFTGIPLRQTINEGDGPLYTSALESPAQNAAIIVAFDGDEIDQAVKKHPENLTEIGRYAAPGQPTATVYVSDTPVVNSRQQQ